MEPPVAIRIRPAPLSPCDREDNSVNTTPWADLPKRIKYEVRGILELHPRLFFPVAGRNSKTRDYSVSRDSGLVIEGFPRSANTFAVEAFKSSQKQSVRLAHHLHVPAQIVRAAQYGIPTLVLVRPPEDAVISLLIREPSISPAQGLRDYFRYYEAIRPCRPAFVIGRFEDVTSAYGGVIARVNARFSTSFDVFEHSPENTAAVFGRIEGLDRADTGLPTVTETTVARPSRARQLLKARFQETLHAPALLPLLARAQDIYADFTS